MKGFGDAVTALFINSDANYHIFADLNSPNEMKGTYQKGKIVCERDNILTNGIFTLGTDSSPAATLYLKEGHSQIIDILSAPLGKNPGTYSSSALVTATEEHPATLTIKSAAYGKSAGSGCNVQFDGAVSVEFGDGTKDDGVFYLVNDTIKGKTERFTSDTTGTIMARSGDLTLGEGCTFTALSGIIVSNGNLQVKSGAVVPETIDLYFMGTGKLSMADDVELRCDRLFVKDDTKPTGYRQLPSGGYSWDTLSDYIAAGSLEVLSDPPVETEEFHWTGEAADDLLTTPGNWQEAAAPDFTKKNAVLHFENNGDHARLSADGEVRGVEVDAATFALEGSDYQLGIGADGLAVAAGCMFTNNCGLIAATPEVAWTFGAGAKFTVNGPLASVGELLFDAGGGATFQFDADSPDLEQGIEVINTSGDDRVVTVATPYAFGPEGITIYNSMPFFTGGVESNASPIVVRDLQHNTKLQFYSASRFHQSGRLSMYSQSSASDQRPYVYVKGNLTLSGGVDFHTGRAIFDFASQATLRITNETITADAGVDFRAGSCNGNTVYFDTAVTNIGSSLYIGRVRLVCGGENVLPYANLSTVSLGIQSEGTDNDNRMCWVDLNGYDQKIGLITPPEMSKLARGDPALAFAEVSSATPATLTHWHMKDKYGGSTKGIPLKVTGQASFTHDVDKRTLVISNAVSTTAGTLTVKRGTVQFQSGAGWGGGEVVVKGGAKLDVLADAMSTAFANPAAGASRSEVNLAIEEDGVLSLGEGTTNVRMASYAGQGYARGYYVASDSSEPNATKVGWITGAGKLRVLGTAGTQIILR